MRSPGRRRPQVAVDGGGAERRPPAGRARTCASCRRRRPAGEMVAWPGAGRRLYACIARACLERLSRAGGAAPLAELARARLMQMVGLARRSGALALGLGPASAVAGRPAARGPAGDAPLAPDDGRAADGGGARGLVFVTPEVPEARRARLPGAHLWPAGELARAAGLAEVRALAIRPGRLAAQAAYWLRLWYECAPWAAPPTDVVRAGDGRAVAAGERANTTASEVG